MNRKLWIRKALSMCLVVATMATYSMVALASSERVAGELLVSGKNIDGQTAFVKINGEMAQSGRSVFSSSTVVTPEDASAIINLGKIGKIELAPNTTLALSFDDKGINGDLIAGRLNVLSAADAVNVKTTGGKTLKLNAGESATSGQTGGQTQDDDDDDNDGGSAGLLYALVVGGAIVGLVLAARTDNNRIALGGGATIVSPLR
ncbi:MAG: hypothetical protein LC768_18155 [Acidobacteria bacterium]|nr:hypothetical protein [Acidobacteriota bacterium]MCA1640217.1 hypothetical protein [Acidobacteriota bacterium]